MGPAVVLGRRREAEGLRGQLSPVATDPFSLLCGHAHGVRSQCFLPVSDGHHGRLRQRACWAQEVVSVAVVWRSVSGEPWARGADGSGTACHVCYDLAPILEGGAWGLQASPSPGRQRVPESGVSLPLGALSWWPQAGWLCPHFWLLGQEAGALPRLRF